MKPKKGMEKALALLSVALIMAIPMVSASYVKVDSSYSSTVTLDSWGDFYCVPVHDGMKVSYSVHVRNGSGVSVFLLKGNYTNLISALDASYLVAYSSEDPKMDFSATYDVTNDDEDYMTVFVYGDDNSTTYDVSVSARELSAFEKTSNIVLGILFLVGIVAVPSLLRHYVRKSRREKKAAELARQSQMQQMQAGNSPIYDGPQPMSEQPPPVQPPSETVPQVPDTPSEDADGPYRLK